jgi:hypothetical protein
MTRSREGSSTSSSSRVAFATNTDFPQCGPDDRTAITELEHLGVDVTPAVWDDPSIDWATFEAVVVRSTWGYDRRGDEFLEWVERVSQVSRLWNSPELLRWNSHKGYLLDLARRGADIVPTEVLRRGSSRSLRSVLEERGWSAAVLKPAIGANAALLRVVRADEREAGEAHLRELLREGDALVQPLLTRVERSGERSLVFLDGRFSHAAEYPHVLSGGNREGTPLAVDDRTCEAAGRIVAGLPVRPLYARADFLPGDGGAWQLSELELIEPYLFLRTDPGAPGRFARAIVRWLDTST